MSTPGISLFQGTESIKVNNSYERAAEEEDLEDQMRRKQELEKMMQGAFNDLDDDETTVDSTSNFQLGMIDHLDHGQCNNHVNNDYPAITTGQNFDKELQQLNILLESKERELETFKQIANDEKNKRNELEKRYTLANAELDRALASKKNTHELLVECKEKCSNLENVITKLKGEKKAVEAENNELIGKLETAQSLLSDTQRKYDMVERDLNRQNDRNAELKRKHFEERHRAEIEMMQQQIDQISSKLEKKSNELENMNTRYKALQNSHELMLLDKTTKINDLSKVASEAQKKCEELLNKPDYFQENIRLQKLVASLQDQIQKMEKTISALTERLQSTSAELDVLDSVLHQHNGELTPRRLSQTNGAVFGSTPINTADRVGNLKNELYRALANLKNKRDEIRRLQNSLDEKQNEIKLLKDEENKALVLISTLTEEKIRVENRLKLVERELDSLRNKLDNINEEQGKIEPLSNGMQQLQDEKLLFNQQRIEWEKEKNKLDEECRKLNFKLRNIEVDFEELKQEHESLKINYEQTTKENQNLRNRNNTDNLRLDLEKHKILLKDAQGECDRLKDLYVNISNAKEALALDLEKLRSTDINKRLKEELEKKEHLQNALQLANLKSSEMTKLLEAGKISHEREIIALKEKLEKERNNRLKDDKNSSNNCRKCVESLAEITKFEIESLKLKNEISSGRKQIDALTQQLHEAKRVISDLSEKLKLSDQQEELIKELKAKAEQFEDYVKSKNNSSENSSPIRQLKIHSKVDKAIVTSPDMDMNSIKKIEARIRDEMAKIFAIEIKRFQMKLFQTEEEYAQLQSQYKKIHTDLMQRQTEVEVLKEAILAEREKFGDIIKQKESDFKDDLQKQHNTLLKKSEEVQDKNAKIKTLMKELEDRQSQIEAERKSMKAVMAQWEEHRQEVDTVERQWKEKMQDFKKMHDVAILSWQSKYHSAKRTAVNYKRYAEDKESYMLKEYDRIKSEYESKLTKLETQVRETLEKKNKEMKDSMAVQRNRESNYDSDKENKGKNGQNS